jgi:hypothetical protein
LRSIGQVGQRFGQVAARFTLDGDGDAEEVELGHGEPVGGFLQRIVHAAADADAFGHQLEFLPHGPRHFGGNHIQRFGDGQARFEPAHQKFDGIGKLGGEIGVALLDEIAHHQMRQARARGAPRPAPAAGCRS